MDKLREEFEQWFSTREKAMKSQGLGLISISRLKSRQWEAWQASRASIVVELPEIVGYGMINRGEILANIRSIGLSIKGDGE